MNESLAHYPIYHKPLQCRRCHGTKLPDINTSRLVNTHGPVQTT